MGQINLEFFRGNGKTGKAFLHFAHRRRADLHSRFGFRKIRGSQRAEIGLDEDVIRLQGP